MILQNNLYDGTKGNQETGLGGGTEGPVAEPFTQLPYPYRANPAADVPALVMRGAGPQQR